MRRRRCCFAASAFTASTVLSSSCCGPCCPTSCTLRAGTAVLDLQRALQRDGLLAASGATGRFNARTARAVAAWQRARGLSPSGRLDGVALQLFELEQVHRLHALARMQAC